MEPIPKKLKLIDFCVAKDLYENRYCNQDGFSALLCGSKNPVSYKCKNKVLEVNLPSFEITTFPLVVNISTNTI